MHEEFNGNEVLVGNCVGCSEKRVLIRYEDEAYCIRCIETNDHLSVGIGWMS